MHLSFDFGTPDLIEIPFSFGGKDHVFVEPNGTTLVECQQLLTSSDKVNGEVFILLMSRCLYTVDGVGDRKKASEDYVRALPSRVIMEIGRKIMTILGIEKQETVQSLREQIETATRKLAALESGETMAKN